MAPEEKDPRPWDEPPVASDPSASRGQVAYPIWDTSLLTELDDTIMEQLFTDANLLDVWEARRRPGEGGTGGGNLSLTAMGSLDFNFFFFAGARI